MARHPADTPCAPVRRPAALVVALALATGGLAGGAAAQGAPATDDPAPKPPAVPSTPAAPPTPAGAAAVQRVEISGSADANADRRRSTAAKIVYGRDELDRMGDSTLGEVLKRLPGVTMGGPPGRGGNPSMRGMGGGYTAILIDGQRMPFGFSLDSIAPEQIERIEIMRSPVAEHGARAIAGIINVVMREDFKRKTNELRLGVGLEDDRHPQANGNWTYSGQNEGLGYNLSAAFNRQHQAEESTGRRVDSDDAGKPVLEQRTGQRSLNRREGVFVNGRFQFRLGPGHTLDLNPMASVGRSRSSGQHTLVQAPDPEAAPYALADQRTDADSSMARLNGNWQRTLGNGGRLQLRFATMLARSASLTQREEYAFDGLSLPRKVDDGSVRDLSLELNGKYSQLIADRHSVSAGWELQGGQRSDRRLTTEGGEATLAEFGDALQARTLRLAGWAQDEWEWSKTFSFYAGLRWEGIQTTSDGVAQVGGAVLQEFKNRSGVLTPLAHMVWKLPDAPRDQVRLSLTRSYKSPTTSQLIARPTVATLHRDTTQPNKPLNPDRAGNPDLKPELAWGLDLAFEHYLDAGGIVSANLFARQIDQLIRTVRAEEQPTWAVDANGQPVTRWVARPQNIGRAAAAGLELEAKFRPSDLWVTDLPLTLRANGSLLWSKVDGVAGPNNRLDQQPRYTANLGFDWPLRGMPLTFGGSFNFTPSFVVQQIDSQVYRQGVKRVLDAYALWRFGTAASARLSLANASASDYDTGTTVLLADGSTQAQDTLSRTYTNVTLRFELRF
ncbi:TonB-dependent siderophore receptor [Ideonella sp. A 288]|uniref:TonB-dependent receptor plug domain-containing protein n=1 Tax=Ideonella sp. A 288 TaxID=1962181 RepID=UPI000B4C1285|nr:TonB-dependent receptor [Ideonella sp. A 288]